MTIIDAQVHAYAANTPERPWRSVPNWPPHVTGDEMVAAMGKVGVDGAIYISPFSMYQYDASYVPLSGYRRGDVASSVVTPAPDASGGRSREDNMRILSAVCIILGAIGTQPALAEPSASALAPRTEIHAIETITLSDQQLLTDDKNGQRITIAGQLRFPRDATGRLPAVILLHGSGGIGAREEFWSKYLSELGIASFLVDSFTGRGITQTSTDQAQLGRLATILDGYRAFDVLAAHPRIDSSRIALMGFSRGGTATLYANMTRLHEMWNPRANFAAYIPLYASCSARLIGDTDISPAPLRQFHGMADDWVTVAPCRPYFERLRAAGRDAKLTEYPDAHHSYDNPLGSKTPVVAKDAQSTRDCFLKEEPRGIIINVKSGQPFSYKDPCVVLDPHTGYNEAAALATRNEVTALLKTVFKL